MTIKTVAVKEVLLCSSILSGANDCIIAVPVGDKKIDRKSMRFQGLYMSLDAQTVFPPHTLNNTKSGLLDDRGAFHVDVLAVFETKGVWYAQLCIHANKKLIMTDTAAPSGVFCFQYWWQAA
jgi:hypothetical protein